MSVTEIILREEWDKIDWNEVETSVFQLQKRIYKASISENIPALRRLQKLLLSSWRAKLLAVKQVLELPSREKAIAGIDGVKDLCSRQCWDLARDLEISPKCSAPRRLYLEELGAKEGDSIKVPTMYDRAVQALVLLALEPEWEARFDPNSYGYRPGRSLHDALKAIRLAIAPQPQYFLTVDLAPCFMMVDRVLLLDNFNTFPKLRRQLNIFLKKGAIDWNLWAKRKQHGFEFERAAIGQIITPFLVNVFFQGMEDYLKKDFELTADPVKVVRYADDLVIFSTELKAVEKCRGRLDKFLEKIGLKFNDSQTYLGHTLEEFAGNKPGFDFQTYNIRQFPTKLKSCGFTSQIAPSKDEFKRHYRELADRVKSCNPKTQGQLIARLNPIICNWSRERSFWNSSKIFNKLDYQLHQRLWRWGIRRHPKKGKKWIANKYWHTIGNSKWVFAAFEAGKKSIQLLKHTQFGAGKRWHQIDPIRSPFDSDDDQYWQQRISLSEVYFPRYRATVQVKGTSRIQRSRVR